MNPYESSVSLIILSCVGKIYMFLGSTKMEIVRKREGHNPAWMKALCIITSSVCHSATTRRQKTRLSALLLSLSVIS